MAPPIISHESGGIVDVVDLNIRRICRTAMRISAHRDESMCGIICILDHVSYGKDRPLEIALGMIFVAGRSRGSVHVNTLGDLSIVIVVRKCRLDVAIRDRVALPYFLL